MWKVGHFQRSFSGKDPLKDHLQALPIPAQWERRLINLGHEQQEALQFKSDWPSAYTCECLCHTSRTTSSVAAHAFCMQQAHTAGAAHIVSVSSLAGWLPSMRPDRVQGKYCFGQAAVYQLKMSKPVRKAVLEGRADGIAIRPPGLRGGGRRTQTRALPLWTRGRYNAITPLAFVIKV